MRWIAWFAILASAILPTAAAQSPATLGRLRIGTVELSLGMPEKSALGSLRHEFRVERARSAGDDWAVIDHGSTIAVASFSAGKLSRVSKSWVSTEDSGAALLSDRLYALAGEFASQGRTACTLAAKPYQVGPIEGRIVTLACGNESIQLIQIRSNPNEWTTSLQEVLQ
jgi:hypothetical protein